MSFTKIALAAGRHRIITSRELRDRYDTVPTDFKPTHIVTLRAPRQDPIIDYIRVVNDDPFDRGLTPECSIDDPAYLYSPKDMRWWRAKVPSLHLSRRIVEVRMAYFDPNGEAQLPDNPPPFPIFDGNPDGYVYFIEAPPSAIKVGYARNIRKRMNALQTANPTKLRLVAAIPGSLKFEQWLHLRLSDFRAPGGQEWFERDAVIAWLESQRIRMYQDDFSPPLPLSKTTLGNLDG